MFDPTDPDALSQAQIDARLGLPRQLEAWEVAEAWRLKHWELKKARAIAAVQYAIKTGELPRLPQPGLRCMDCDELATVYEHRDYDKPLDVRPFCKQCNTKQGPAKGSPYRANHSGEHLATLGYCESDYTPDLDEVVGVDLYARPRLNWNRRREP